MPNRYFYVTFFALFMASCQNGGDFEAGKSGRPVATTAPKEEVSTPSDVEPANEGVSQPTEETPKKNPDCGEGGVTKVALLTTQVQNNAADQKIRYEVSLEDCYGKPLPLTGRSILYDANAALEINPSFNDQLPYKILDGAGSALTSGTFNKVYGSDFFGNTQAGVYHLRTDNLSLAASSLKVVLEIDVSFCNHFDVGNSVEVPNQGWKHMTYLRIADATPVQQEVLFLN